MTRRRVLLFALPALLAVLGAAVLVLSSRTAITPANAAKITNGMTLPEVEELLGGPRRNESGMPDNFIRDAIINPDRAEIERGHLHEQRWASRGFVVIVNFDDAGRVVRHTEAGFEVDRSILDTLRRWLHL